MGRVMGFPPQSTESQVPYTGSFSFIPILVIKLLIPTYLCDLC